MKYSQFEKQRFNQSLSAYRQALEHGSSEEIIRSSLAIHAALSRVPKSYSRIVNSVFRNTRRDSKGQNQ